METVGMQLVPLFTSQNGIFSAPDAAPSVSCIASSGATEKWVSDEHTEELTSRLSLWTIADHTKSLSAGNLSAMPSSSQVWSQVSQLSFEESCANGASCTGNLDPSQVFTPSKSSNPGQQWKSSAFCTSSEMAVYNSLFSFSPFVQNEPKSSGVPVIPESYGLSSTCVDSPAKRTSDPHIFEPKTGVLSAETLTDLDTSVMADSVMAAAAAAAVAAVANVAKPSKAGEHTDGADLFSKDLSGDFTTCSDDEIPGWTAVKQPSRHVILTNVFFEERTAMMFFAEYGDIEFVSTTVSPGVVVVSYYDLRSAQYAKEVIQSKLGNDQAKIFFASPTSQHGVDFSNGTLVVFNLAASVTNEDLCKLFSTYGTVKEVRENPHNRNHRFVEYHDVRSAEAALTGLNRGVLKGKQIRVQLSHATGDFNKRRFTSRAKGGKCSLQSPSGTQLSAQVADPPSVLPVAGNVFGSVHPASNAFTAQHAALYTAQRAFGENLRSEHQQKSEYPFKYPESLSADIAVPGVLETQRSCAPHSTIAQCAPAGPANSIQLSFPPPQPVTGSWPTAFSQAPGGLSAVSSEQQCSANQYVAINIPAQYLAEQLVTQGTFAPSILKENLEDSNVAVASLDAYGGGATGLKYWTAGGSQSSTYPVASGHFETPVVVGGVNQQSAPHISLSSVRLTEDQMRNRLVQVDTISPVDARAASGGRSGCHKKETLSPSASSIAVARTIDPFELDLQKVMAGKDNRTALMIRNIPNKYTQDMLLNIINKNHKGQYDFFYLPIDFRNKCNVGYAFINMTNPQYVVAFHMVFHNKKWEHFNSEKITGISYARIQTRSALIAHFQNSSLLHEDKCCRPVLFNDAGEQEAFPRAPHPCKGKKKVKKRV